MKRLRRTHGVGISLGGLAFYIRLLMSLQTSTELIGYAVARQARISRGAIAARKYAPPGDHRRDVIRSAGGLTVTRGSMASDGGIDHSKRPRRGDTAGDMPEQLTGDLRIILLPRRRFPTGRGKPSGMFHCVDSGTQDRAVDKG